MACTALELDDVDADGAAADAAVAPRRPARCARSSSLVGFLIALSNAFGMILVVTTLGYGLVDVPRKYWRMASMQRSLSEVGARTRRAIDAAHQRRSRTAAGTHTTRRCVRAARK